MAFRVYTKTGDKGTTALIGGSRVSKDNIRIDAYGTVDELNSHIGMLLSMNNIRENIVNELREIQDRLFTIGSALATDPNKELKMSIPDIHDEDTTLLESWIDAMDDQLPMLKNFVLPGGSVAASQAHIARCVCRRAERICVQMQNNNETVPNLVIQYLNRLSDYLFVLSRYILFIENAKEIEWIPRLNKK